MASLRELEKILGLKTAAVPQAKEPLDEEWLPYLHGYNGNCGLFQHPFCCCLCDPHDAGFINRCIRDRMQRLPDLVRKKEWGIVMSLYETAFLCEAFARYERQFDDTSYWRILGEVWIQQEQLWPNRHRYLSYFTSKRPDRQCLMTPEEHTALGALPDEFPIYRGFLGQRGKGMSWTLEESQAEWFAHRFAMGESKQPRLAEGIVAKKHVLAYFDGRNEKEIVVDPAKVRSVKTRVLPPKPHHDRP